MRRRSFVLIEVVISLALFATLLTVLFSIFLHASRVNGMLAEEVSRHEQIVIAHSKLRRALSEARFSTMRRPYFYIKDEPHSGQSLIFTFHNQTSKDPDFSSDVLAKLSIEDNCLVMTYWPHPKTPVKEVPAKYEREILLTNVSELDIKVFCLQSDNDSTDETKPQPPDRTWTSHFPLEYDTQPLLIHIKAGKEHFWHVFANKLEPIVYKRT